MNKRILGDRAEFKAIDFLRKKHYTVLEKNYYTKCGEIDIIAQKDGYIVFAEVKSRKNTDFGHACEAVTYSKQEKIRKAALLWLSFNKNDLQPRFDVIEVYTESDTINHIENAF